MRRGDPAPAPYSAGRIGGGARKHKLQRTAYPAPAVGEWERYRADKCLCPVGRWERKGGVCPRR